MATGVIHSDGTIRNQGEPEGSPWRCRDCGTTQIYSFQVENDLGVTVVDGDEDDNATCGNVECPNGILRPVRRPRRRRQAVDMMCAKCRVRPLYDGATNLCQECDTPAPAQEPKLTLPVDSAARKAIPMAAVLDYFPAALVEVAKLCKAGNDKHNPGTPLHWARGKSHDHADCVIKHFIDRGIPDPDDNISHTVKLVWRSLALLQLECEANGAPMSRGSRAE